jgi:hypothetical protein
MNQGNSFFQSPFAPLGRIYCDYFFWLSVINFIILLYILFSLLFAFLFDKKKEGLFQIFLISLPTFLGYFTNRLLYSMCIGSTQM